MVVVLAPAVRLSFRADYFKATLRVLAPEMEATSEEKVGVMEADATTLPLAPDAASSNRRRMTTL